MTVASSTRVKLSYFPYSYSIGVPDFPVVNSFILVSRGRRSLDCESSDLSLSVYVFNIRTTVCTNFPLCMYLYVIFAVDSESLQGISDPAARCGPSCALCPTSVRRRSELEWLWNSHFNDIATAVCINSARGRVRGRAPVPCRRYPRGNACRLPQG